MFYLLMKSKKSISSYSRDHLTFIDSFEILMKKQRDVTNMEESKRKASKLIFMNPYVMNRKD